ncbi:hypothetical protein HII13_003207 [Brettanomyces bruxellensis]|nr:hypothetical protein HII13_003207 [Brettanomyces bruxellensis]
MTSERVPVPAISNPDSTEVDTDPTISSIVNSKDETGSIRQTRESSSSEENSTKNVSREDYNAFDTTKFKPICLKATDMEDMIREISSGYKVPEILVKSLFDMNSRNRTSDGRIRSSDRMFVLNLESEIVDFIVKPNVDSWKLTPLNSYYRLLTHKLAEYYNLGHILSNDGYSMVLFKINTSLVNADDEIKRTAKFDEDGNIKPLDFRNLKFDPMEKLNRVKLSQIYGAYKEKFHCVDAESLPSEVGLVSSEAGSNNASNSITNGFISGGRRNIRIMRRHPSSRSSSSSIMTSAASATTSVSRREDGRFSREQKYQQAKDRVAREAGDEESNGDSFEDGDGNNSPDGSNDEEPQPNDNNRMMQRHGSSNFGKFRRNNRRYNTYKHDYRYNKYRGYGPQNPYNNCSIISGRYPGSTYTDQSMQQSPFQSSLSPQPGMPPYPFFNPYLCGYQYIPQPRIPNSPGSSPSPGTSPIIPGAVPLGSPATPTYGFFYPPAYQKINSVDASSQKGDQQPEGGANTKNQDKEVRGNSKGEVHTSEKPSSDKSQAKPEKIGIDKKVASSASDHASSPIQSEGDVSGAGNSQSVAGLPQLPPPPPPSISPTGTVLPVFYPPSPFMDPSAGGVRSPTAIPVNLGPASLPNIPQQQFMIPSSPNAPGYMFNSRDEGQRYHNNEHAGGRRRQQYNRYNYRYSSNNFDMNRGGSYRSRTDSNSNNSNNNNNNSNKDGNSGNNNHRFNGGNRHPSGFGRPQHYSNESHDDQDIDLQSSSQLNDEKGPSDASTSFSDYTPTSTEDTQASEEKNPEGIAPKT